MRRKSVDKNSANLRVALAYYKYGCFCASHPLPTILLSIFCVLFLSYPLFRPLTFRLPSTSPYEVFFADGSSSSLSSDHHSKSTNGQKSQETNGQGQSQEPIGQSESVKNETSRDHTPTTAGSADKPNWFRADSSVGARSVFIQQIYVRTKLLEPWTDLADHDLTVKDNVKGFLDSAFDLYEDLNQFSTLSHATKDGKNVNVTMESICFRLTQKDAALQSIKLPDQEQRCLILSPGQFWQNDRRKFLDDNNVVDTVFLSAPCIRDFLCVRDLLFGLPMRSTGVKMRYQLNRARRLQFAVTLVLKEYDRKFLQDLKSHIRQKYARLDAAETFTMIFYKARKSWLTYLPLYLSYLFVFIYLYFSVRKIEMVKSKWGLAFGAVFAVAASLTMASGICIHFDLTPRINGGALYPYLAMIVGIENVMCITHSVVSTPANLNVKSRIAHGLSNEGYSITKHFLVELAVVTVGFFTQIPEIQEFCTLAIIGLVVDFFMQLFFYAPCLTFDLLRFDAFEKRQLSLAQLRKDPVALKSFPPVHCPIWSRISQKYASSSGLASDRMFRARSLNSLLNSDDEDDKVKKYNNRRRTTSNPGHVTLTIEKPSHLSPSLLLAPFPRRLVPLRFMSQTRVCQRLVLIVVVGWICWLALIVHKWRVIVSDVESLTSNVSFDKDASHFYTNHNETLQDPTSHNHYHAFHSNRQMFANHHDQHDRFYPYYSLQRRTYGWWPILFDLYNVSLSEKYVTLLPPMVVNMQISPERAKELRSSAEPRIPHSKEKDFSSRNGKKPADNNFSSGIFTSDLRLRISWLELQMVIVLIMSCGVFLIVGAFIIYVCCLSGTGSVASSRSSISVSSPDNIHYWPDWFDKATNNRRRVHRRVGSKTIVDSVPIPFRGHENDVETMCPCNGTLVSTCLGGKVIIWDSMTGDVIRSLQRERMATVQPMCRNSTPVPPSQSNSTTAMNLQGGSPETTLHRRTHLRQHSVGGYDFSRCVPQTVSSWPKPDENLDWSESSTNPASPPIWCMTVHGGLITLGTADGSLEFYNLNDGRLRCQYKEKNTWGITHLVCRGGRIVAARLNGHLDFLQLRMIQDARCLRQSSSAASAAMTSSPPPGVLRCFNIKSMKVHQRIINCLKSTAGGAVVTASDDHTLKIFRLSDCQLCYTLHGHNAAVKEVIVDDQTNMIYSCCSDGLICFWDLNDGSLLKTISDVVSYGSIDFTSVWLVGCGSDGYLRLWRKKSGELITVISPTDDDDSSSDSGIDDFDDAQHWPLCVLNENLIATGFRNRVRFWDLTYKTMLREVTLDKDGSAVKSLIPLDQYSVACCKGNYIYRVNFPILRFA